MKLTVSKSKNAASLYVTKSVYHKGKRTSYIVEKLGTEDELRKNLHGEDPYEWARNYIEQLNKQEKAHKRTILLEYSSNALIPKNEQYCFNGGYLFLQKIYFELKLNKLCAQLQNKYKISFSLN